MDKIAGEGPTSRAAQVPVAITRRDDGIVFEWDRAGDRTWIGARELRLACPCAQCVEEMSGRPLLDPAMIPTDIRPLHLALVGAYGLRVHWSDGHATGIYTYDMLRGMALTAPPAP